MLTGNATVKVRFAETDAMGVVYHGNYLPWLECARIDLVANTGFPYERLIEMGYHLPVVDVHVHYKYPARFGDEVEIRAAIKSMPTVKVKVEYELFSGGRLLATAETTHVFVNFDGQPVKPPKEFVEKIAENFVQC